MRIAIVTLFALTLTVSASAQELLSDAEVSRALASKNDSPGLWMSEFDMAGTGGFAIGIFSPSAWLQNMQREARREFRTLALQDVGPDDRRRVWRIRANPKVPLNNAVRADTLGADSVKNVVIRDKKAATVFQPTAKLPFTRTLNVIGGSTMDFTGYLATFSDADFLALWGPGRTQEFVITVIGERSSKDFEVKKKHFAELSR